MINISVIRRSGVLFIATLLTLLLWTNTTYAYLTTGQAEYAVGNHTGLFIVEFAFGSYDHEIFMPALARHGGDATTDGLTYEILNEHDVPVAGVANGIVLSNAPLNNDAMYVTEVNESRLFTLIVLFTPESNSTRNSKYRLHVTSLPFQFNGTQQLQLNPSELIYYKTNLLPL